MSAKIERPALSGSHGEIALFQLDGRMFSSGGITKKSPANAAMPPAVFRTIAPIGEREDADQHQVEGAAEHRARDAGVRERDLQDVVAVRIAWLRKNAITTGPTISANVTTAKTRPSPTARAAASAPP